MENVLLVSVFMQNMWFSGTDYWCQAGDGSILLAFLTECVV